MAGLRRLRFPPAGDAIKNPPGLRLLLGLVQQGVLHRQLDLTRFQIHGLEELLARQLIFTDFQLRIAEIFRIEARLGATSIPFRKLGTAAS